MGGLVQQRRLPGRAAGLPVPRPGEADPLRRDVAPPRPRLGRRLRPLLHARGRRMRHGTHGERFLCTLPT